MIVRDGFLAVGEAHTDSVGHEGYGGFVLSEQAAGADREVSQEANVRQENGATLKQAELNSTDSLREEAQQSNAPKSIADSEAQPQSTNNPTPSGNDPQNTEHTTKDSTQQKPDKSQEPPIPDTPVEDDARYKALKKQQEELQKKIDSAKRFEHGIEQNIRKLEEDAKNARWYNLRFDGTQAQERVENEKKLLDAQRKQVARLEQQQRDAQREYQRAVDLEEQGRRAHVAASTSGSPDDLGKAQDLYNQAQLARQKAAGAITDTNSLDVQATKTSIREGQRINDDAMENIKLSENVETGLRITRDFAVIAGATIATAGTMAVVGGVAGVAAGVTAGTAYGTAIGAGSAYTEAEGHIAQGNKTEEQAYSDAWDQTKQYAKDSLVASVSTVVGGGVGNAITKGGKVASVGTRVAAGMSGGASASVASDTMEVAYKVATGQETRSLGEIVTDVATNALVGAVSGGVGARAGIAKQGQGVVRRVATTGAQVVVEAGIGVAGEVAKQVARGEEITAEGVMESAGRAVWSGLVGEIASGAADHAAPLGTNRRAPHSTGEVPTNAGSHHVEVNGVEGNVQVSKNGAAEYVDNPDLLKEKYVEARKAELQKEHGDSLSEAEIDTKARKDAENVEAYFDPESGRLVAGTTPNGRDQRIEHGSTLAHEDAHRKGGSEAEAWRAKADYLQRNGYQLDMSGEVPTIRRAPAGSEPRQPTDAEIDRYVGRNYGQDERGSGRLAAQRSAVEQAPTPQLTPEQRREADRTARDLLGNSHLRKVPGGGRFGNDTYGITEADIKVHQDGANVTARDKQELRYGYHMDEPHPGGEVRHGPGGDRPHVDVVDKRGGSKRQDWTVRRIFFNDDGQMMVYDKSGDKLYTATRDENGVLKLRPVKEQKSWLEA